MYKVTYRLFDSYGIIGEYVMDVPAESKSEARRRCARTCKNQTIFTTLRYRVGKAVAA